MIRNKCVPKDKIMRKVKCVYVPPGGPIPGGDGFWFDTCFQRRHFSFQASDSGSNFKLSYN